MKRQISSFFAAFIALLSLTAFTAAQETAAPQTERQHNRGFGKHHRRGARMDARAFDRLNLTDAQKQQVSQLLESQNSQTKAVRDELKQLHEQKRQNGQFSAEQETRAQALRAQLEAASQKSRADLQAILTAEQRAQLEQMRGQGFGGKRGGFGKAGRGGMMRGLGSLNLTEAQQQQARTIFESERNGSEALRAEMKQLKTAQRQGALSTEQQNRFNELRAQLRDSMKKTQEQFQAILTEEQRQQIQQRRQSGNRFGKRRMTQPSESTPQQ